MLLVFDDLDFVGNKQIREGFFGFASPFLIMRQGYRSLEEVHRSTVPPGRIISRTCSIHLTHSLDNVTLSPGWRCTFQVSLPGVCSSLFFCFYDKHQDQKAVWRGKGVFELCFLVTIHYWGNSGQKFNIETWSRNHQGVLLAGSFSALLCCLVYTTQAHLPKDGITRSGVGHPKSFTNQENVP